MCKCKDLLKEEDRIIDVYWYTEKAASYNVDITVYANDRSGLLAEVIQVLSNLKTKLIGLN
ncbi:MAG: ACT domain-containing protein [Clostridia bacterium]